MSRIAQGGTVLLPTVKCSVSMPPPHCHMSRVLYSEVLLTPAPDEFKFKQPEFKCAQGTKVANPAMKEGYQVN